MSKMVLFKTGDRVEVKTVIVPDTWRKGTIKSVYWGSYAVVMLDSVVIVNASYKNMRLVES